jgi:hypothetical protein
MGGYGWGGSNAEQLFGTAFGFPVSRLGGAVPFGFDFALDGIAADFAVVFGGDLVAVEFAGDLEGDLVALKFGLFDRRIGVVAAGHGASEFVAFELQLERGRAGLAISAGHGPCPSAGWIGLFVIGLRSESGGQAAEREREEEGEDAFHR